MKKFLLTMCLVGLSVFTFAQSVDVSGTVTSEDDGLGLPGVSVTIQGTTRGTTSDVDGKYNIATESGSTLVFSFVGMNSQSILIGNQTVINVSLASDANQLSEVVVTALGVSREKKSLGYAMQEVEGDQISTVKDQNFVNSLSGKVAGMQVRQNNTMGGSTNVLIRGNNSLASNNQPLFVIDGVPLSNYRGNEDAYQTGGRPGYDYGNAASDINPEDVENISVLKGAAATALYGSRGANGVIMITTKKGRTNEGIGVTLSSTVTTGSIDKSTFTEYQTKYGAGYSKSWYDQDWMNLHDVNGDGVLDEVVPTADDGSYGAPFDPNRMVYQWESFVPESENYGKPMPWVMAQNTPANYFFENQLTFNNSVALDGGNDQGSFRLGYTNFDNKGVLPNSTQKRHNIALNSSYKFGDRLTATTSLNYSRQATVGRYGTGYSGLNPMQSMRQWFQTNVDMERQEHFYKSTGKNYTWNQADPVNGDIGPIYTDNAYWTRYENYNSDNRNRLMGNIALDFKITDWVSIMARVGTDTYTELREERLAIGSSPTEFGINHADEPSGYSRRDMTFTEMNYDVMANFNHRFNDDLSLSGITGVNIRTSSRERIWQSTAGGLAVPGIWAITNSLNTPPIPVESLAEKQVNGYYVSASLGWKDTYFLDLSDRYDVSSALPTENNAYNYYAASASFVFSNLIDANWLRFGKLRFGYAEVGNDTSPLNVNDVYKRSDNFGGAIMTSVPNTKNNPNLRPERTKSWEAGLEMNTLGGRLGLDMSVYQVNTVDQILRVTQSTATGNSYRYVNAGDLSNKGVEISLSGTPVQVGGFTWDMMLNWSKNTNKVEKLYADIENIQLASYQGGISLNATLGDQYGTIRGTGFEYDDNGNKVINGSGYYKAVADQVLGVAAPDWMAGLNNSLTYKGFNLSFLIDMSQGGEVYSLDMHYGQGTGMMTETAGLNDLGNPLRLSLDEGGGIIQEGVLEDGSVNTIRAPSDAYSGVFYWGNSSRNPAALTTYDASYIKLREAALRYTIPSSLYSNWANNISVAVIGRNLWTMVSHVPHSDPEAGLGAGNAQGYISGAYPVVRSMGFNVTLEF